MKTIKRISLASLVLVIVLSSLLAIPASAAIYYEKEEGNFSGLCDDGSGGYFAEIQASGLGAEARTEFSHENTHTSTTTVYVSTKFWHYPSGSSQANYRTTTLYQTQTGTSSATAKVTSSSISGVIFSAESYHTLTMICNGTAYPQKVAWTCVGEPAMK